MTERTIDAVATALFSDDDGRVCRDIPESACKVQPRNRAVHVVSLTATKIADGLIDPKLVLSWLIGALGAPQALAGLLVPVREAGALLPQMLTAPRIRAMPRRKLAWAGGSLVQGLCALGIAVVALTMDGAAAGWAIVGLLGLLALARSVCSVAYKDVLGKTVSKSQRGSTTGLAASAASAGVLLFSGALLVFGASLPLVTGAIALAGALWIFAFTTFLTLREEPGATEGGGSALAEAVENLSLLREDPQLLRFIAARGLLTSTALAPPFIVALAGTDPGEFGRGLGALVLGSAAAGLVSGALWGRLADRSSRKVLILAGAGSAAVLGIVAALGALGVWTAGVAIFVAQIAYQGVRLGRSTHLVDMATEETRAAYTALSNTIIGLLLLAGGLYSALAAATGPGTVLAAMAVQSLFGAAVAATLREVQRP